MIPASSHNPAPGLCVQILSHTEEGSEQSKPCRSGLSVTCWFVFYELLSSGKERHLHELPHVEAFGVVQVDYVTFGGPGHYLAVAGTD